jgi:hypothetical protein
MFGTLLILMLILVVTFSVDYRILAAEASRTQWVVYSTLFSIGFIITALYLFNPSLPDPLKWIQSPLQPIGAWVS